MELQNNLLGDAFTQSKTLNLQITTALEYIFGAILQKSKYFAELSF